MDAQLNAQELELILAGMQNARYLALSVFALVVCEYLSNLELEVEYFWSGPWSLSRIMFMINRYLTPIVIVLGVVCELDPA
ncbi:uncharacterized protein FIBRA_00536 [Fibroporia radiculosa]|uniref:DUF6533 domain-containing protein n=1 Tax=Fibroporia radiculosa TaxID=599839 RepID=J4HRS0_9APHY|nr:uncharacterized protein FIBRA_00536 [Fibroporia radiculosa]CCL98537.1 predicted protein [Fibroporia radiculosa]